MEANKAQDAEWTEDEFDQIVLSEYPYPIAVNYRRLLEIKGWEARTRRCIEVFEYSLRFVTLSVLSQYLIRDLHRVSDIELDRKLHRNLSRASLGQWVEFLFLSLRAYSGKRELLFMPELYDWYWDVSQEPHRARKGVRGPFQRLVEIRNDLAHRPPPSSEEGWKSVGKEAWECLRTVLKRFGFLQHYDLIRVVDRYRGEHEYERYTGQETSIYRGQLSGSGELQINWFYLCRKDKSVLRLHPLLIFWSQEGEPQLLKNRQHDMAMYDRLMKEMVEYIATVVREMVKERDADLLAQLRQLIYYNIEHVKMSQKRRDLSWVALQQAVEKLTIQQMGAAWEKYQRALYLQRDEIFQKFQEFLTSDKGCFVLTGKSGVGKSNFVLSLADEFAERQDVSVLIYNGARLSIFETAVQTISSDLAKYLMLEGEAANDLFTELERQNKMAKNTLVVIFDAINESADGRTLLRQIDQMVSEIRYPWLKVVITSRPQAWRTLKRGVRLAKDRYYRERDSDEHWVELQEFAVKLEAFERDELARVYEKYRQVYGLRTEYQALKAPIRNFLRDPLMLRLVADISREQAIPDSVQVSEIYDQYVQALIRTERLYERDVILLERELVPLMIAGIEDGSYANKLTTLQIHAAKTRNGRPLWELIRNDDLVSDGRRVNDSYTRLVDTEILTEQGSPTDYEIVFKYERFYDHYAGKRIYELVSRLPVRLDAYLKWMECVISDPYLWGAIQTALYLELRAGNSDLVEKLAGQESPIVQEMLVGTLIAFARENCDIVERVIQNMYDGRYHRARRTALAVAGGLLAPHILMLAGNESSVNLRLDAVRSTYHLWQKPGYRKIGWDILEAWANSVRGTLGMPKTKVIESCLGLSMLILTEHNSIDEDLETIKRRLQKIWREILANLLFIDEEKNNVIRKGLRGLFFSRAVGFLGAVLRGTYFGRIARGRSVVFLLANSFPVPESRKNAFVRLIGCFDLAYEEIVNQEDLLVEVLTWNDFLSSYVVFLLLTLKLSFAKGHGLALVSRIFKRTLRAERAFYGSPLLAVVAWFILDREPSSIDDTEFDIYHNIMKEYLDTTAGHWYGSNGNLYVLLGLDLYSDVEWKKYHKYQPEMLMYALEKIMPTDHPFVLQTMFEDIARLSNLFGHPKLALEAAGATLKYDDPLIRDYLVDCLASMRLYYPQQVEDFLEEHAVPQNTRHSVRARELTGAIWTLNITPKLAAFISRAASQPSIRKFIVQLINEALDCDSLEQWLKILLRDVVNKIYGEPVL